MWFRKLVILVFVLFVVSDFAFAQEIPSPKDSTQLYEKIEKYSKGSEFTQFLFHLLFKPSASNQSNKKNNKNLAQKPYSTFEGKIIRNINIEALDPFENSIGDTISASKNFISRAGNSLHIQTKAFTIRNLLLIHKNQPFDALRVKESERLVRSMNYITDVLFYVKFAPESKDSVDIFIRALDKWSLIPGGSVTASRATFKLRENNFLGLGHEFQNELVWNHSTGDYAYQTKYIVPNFRNTYINSTLQYGTDEFGNFIKSVAIDRPFFSSYARWGAGINIAQRLHADSVWSVNPMHFKYNQQDFWAGNAIRIFKGNELFDGITNFISSARFIRTRFLEKPPATIDTLDYFVNENFYLTSLGISSRSYVKDKYIFQFGINEDVPVGKVISLTTGYQKKKDIGRVYAGSRFSTGKYYSWGYLSYGLEFGTFLRASKVEQGVFGAQINYFTNLIEVGKWKVRQFVKPQLIVGINRIAYDSLTINNKNGLRGFNSPTLSGKSRLLFAAQTQLYSPWHFIGFRFGPFVNLTLGMLGDAENGFRGSKVYSLIGLGVIIKNENLVMNTFQISISYFPVIPGVGNNVIKFNSFQTVDFGFNDFEIDKPSVVQFQ